jgi:hypothetical protein
MATVKGTAAGIVLILVLSFASSAMAQRIPGQTARPAAIQGRIVDGDGRAIQDARIELRRLAASGRRAALGDTRLTSTGADGVFRFLDLPAGDYGLSISRDGFIPVARNDLRIGRSELVTVELTLVRVSVPSPAQPVVPDVASPYGTLPRPRGGVATEPDVAAGADRIFVPVPDRWNLGMPDWDRYGGRGDYPYVSAHWWDPYNQNRLKGDAPVIGARTFFTFTGVSDSLAEGRNLPTPSGVASARPLSERFFGRGGQYFPVSAVRTSFDLFHGDAAFRPIDWRVRVQPAFSLNFINTSEYGTVNADVRRRSNRVSAHAGLQEAFGEVKLADLSGNYDFISVRAGIQELSSDFRGFLAVLESPGVRVFGTLRSNRLEYNAAFFDLLEKDTNSGFNGWTRRGQQVWVGNVYVQDFLVPGYTAEFSVHASRDRGALHYDRNGFLVRPAPIGLIGTNVVDAYYLGWAGNGHVGRWNVSHAFYQALGSESANPIAAQRIDINAQMAAAEVSIDKDWLRFKGAAFYASGDADPGDGTGRGFDAILDIPVFAGGPFSLWNRQGLRLPQTGTGLVSPSSLLPSLRTSKDDGQANFVNPGIALVNGALDVEVTPRLRGFANVSFLRFMHTQSLETLLFQETVRPNIGLDYGGGVQFRPPLSENIVFVGGIAAMKLGGGMKDIYSRDHLFSLFLNARFVF